jgi:hypothetical protein
MKRIAFLAMVAMTCMPAVVFAQDAPQPKYSPGFDCATLPPGDEREACHQSKLNPTMDDDQNDGDITGGSSETPGSVSPPTFPDEPGNENRDSGPGSSGGAGGVDN